MGLNSGVIGRIIAALIGGNPAGQLNFTVCEVMTPPVKSPLFQGPWQV